MKTKTELYNLTASEIVTGIRNKNFDPVDISKSVINRYNEIEKDIKAWVYFEEEKILENGYNLLSKLTKNQNIGQLFGVPVGIKDIFNTIDMPTCMGSPIWEGFTPGNDARVVSYIRWADANIVGKTVTAEFAVHHPGPTVNPWNYDYSPGTSSSGSAAAVASKMIPLALGTQTAGSTIRPASYCGIYGFKPSFGLLPRTGILKTLDTLDHVSLLARSNTDIRLFFDTLRLKGENFPHINNTLDKYKHRQQDTNGRKWNVAFVKTPVWDEAENYAQDAISNFVSKLSKNKLISIKEVELPAEFKSAHEIHNTIYSKALSYYFQEETQNNPNLVSEIFLEMVKKGEQINFDSYLVGLQNQNKLIDLLDNFFDQFDFIITLSTSSEAPKGINGRDKKDSCLIWTLCHVPAASLPVFKSPNNLPFGAQIVSKKYSDYLLLDFLDFLKDEELLEEWKESEELND